MSVFTRRAGLALTLLTAVSVSACMSTKPRRCDDAPDPAELGRLSTVTDSTVAALKQATDSQAQALRFYLQTVVDRAAELDACGRISSPRDLRAAARLGLAASPLGLDAIERAYRWSRRAVLADTSDRSSWRVMAQAWDQLQVIQQRPQWFATVISCANTPDGRCVLPRIDTTRVTDPQRVELGLRTLVQQREYVDSLNQTRAKP